VVVILLYAVRNTLKLISWNITVVTLGIALYCRISSPDIKVTTPHHGGVFMIEIPESRKASRLEVYEPHEHRKVPHPTT
jgi:hypothetical protein